MSSLLVYVSLFWVALLAATVFPFQSEAVLFGLLLSGKYSWWILVLVATAGNTLGSLINWFIGRNIAYLEQYTWFPIKKRTTIEKAEAWYRRYGKWSLLLSWAPIIGDPITLVAGFLREPLAIFIALVFLAKLGRYLAIAAIAMGLFK